ncbi:MAG TPA: hypothetical protein VLF59_05010 [Candidatus Saccharimonadales bacterium]|nr:hypothetical protein [Candidatus Saccharimonadales bacterium]
MIHFYEPFPISDAYRPPALSASDTAEVPAELQAVGPEPSMASTVGHDTAQAATLHAPYALPVRTAAELEVMPEPSSAVVQTAGKAAVSFTEGSVGGQADAPASSSGDHRQTWELPHHASDERGPEPEPHEAPQPPSDQAVDRQEQQSDPSGLPLAGSGGDKPPIDEPPTTFDEPPEEGDDHREHQEPGDAAGSPPGPADSNQVEVYIRRNTIVTVNPTANPETVRMLAARAGVGPITDGWIAAPPDPHDPTSLVKYFLDRAENPTLLAKVITRPAASEDIRYPGAGKREIEQAAAVDAVINSPEAQAAVQAEGFAGVRYNQPIYSELQSNGDTETVVYPLQQGRRTDATVDPGDITFDHSDYSELNRLDRVTTQLEELLAAQGIVVDDLIAKRFLMTDEASGMPYLHIVDPFYDVEGTQHPTERQSWIESEGGIAAAVIGDYQVVVNRGYGDRALVREVLQQINTATLGDGWVPVRHPDARYDNRAYFRTTAEPRLFFKVTYPPTDNDDVYEVEPGQGVSELYRTPIVRATINSQSAQQAAMARGYSGITYVEPLASLIDRQSGAEITVYPWQDGRKVPSPVDAAGNQIPLRENTDPYNLEYLRYTLQALLALRGVAGNDIHSGQFIIAADGERDHLYFIDAEDFDEIPGDTGTGADTDTEV